MTLELGLGMFFYNVVNIIIIATIIYLIIKDK